MTHSRRIAPIAACVATLFATLASAAEVPAEYRETVQMSKVVGSLLALHQLAAIQANYVLAKRGITKKDERVQGWITDFSMSSAGTIVTYIGDEGGEPKALYRVTVPVKGSPEVESLSPAQPLTESERARFAARNLAIAEFAKRNERCATHYDTVVVPFGRRSDPFFYVYLLAESDQGGVVLAGGDVRYEVSADGAHIDDQRTFSEGCRTLTIPKRKDRDDGEPIKMTVAPDPAPTEWHVRLSRKAMKALEVETPESGLRWLVHKGKVEVLGPIQQAAGG